MGVPYVPVMGLVGSDLLKRREDMLIREDPFNPGVRTVVAKSLRPDVALLHGQKADRAGNVSMGQFNDDTLLAEASRRVIVTVEEVVDKLTEVDSKGTVLPSILVDAVVHAPYGAHPAACPDYYGVDEAHIHRYIEASKSDAAFAAYLEETVFGVKDHGAYVERFVAGGTTRQAVGND